MISKKIFLTITLLILVSLACTIQFDLPIQTDIKTGPTVTDNILVPIVEDSETTAEIELRFGAGELFLSPGDGSTLVDGVAIYNVSDLKPKIYSLGEKTIIETGTLDIDGIPNFDKKYKNNWDLKIGDYPLDLTIKAGAYIGNFELGNLSIVNLHIADGASEGNINFEQPNRIKMQSLRYETGASDITLRNLANANFETMIFESGAGNYHLDFSGTLQDDATVFIETGLSSLTISVPDTTNAQVSVEGGLTNVSARGTWDKFGDRYTIDGDGPVLTITIEMSAGNLQLENP